MKIKNVWVCGLLTLVGACVLTPTTGCGQKNTQVQDLPSNQSNRTGVDQNTAAQGNTYVTLNNGNGPGGGGDAIPITDKDGNIVGVTRSGTAGAGGAGVDKQNATYSQVAYVYTQTGGTSAAPTATNTSGSQNQTPTGTATQTPTQHVQPETSASVPIGVALPGGNVSNQATATGRGTTSDTTKQDDINQTTTTQIIKAQADKIKELEGIIRALNLSPAATSKPSELIPLTPVP